MREQRTSLLKKLNFTQLGITFKPSDVLSADLHFVFAEKLVDVVYESFNRVAQIDRVLSFELSDDFLRQNIVKRVKLVSATAYVYRYIRVDLLHNSVSERDVEMIYKIFVKQFKSLSVASADRKLFECRGDKRFKLLG